MMPYFFVFQNTLCVCPAFYSPFYANQGMHFVDWNGWMRRV